MIARLIFGSAKRFWNLREIPNIHPLFLGFILVIFYNYWYFLEIGIALIVQGLLHHLIILPLWIGESEFL
ncbi:hypothetical protein GF378_00485 [Candidatus Pacearchaeota archaeon]|nr:hypothetical protein [Candidatus Pacearchaeota archaeon]